MLSLLLSLIRGGAFYNYLRHPTCPFFRCEKKTTQKQRSNYRLLLDPPKNARPPKTLDHIPFFHPEEGGIVTFDFFMHSFLDICACSADICARFALRFLLAPFEYSATDHLGGPTSPVLGKTLEAGTSVRLPYFGDDPWFCNTFGLRAEIYVTKGAPGIKGSISSLWSLFDWSYLDYRFRLDSQIKGDFLDKSVLEKNTF